jgi:hypothetical protein
MRKIPFILLWIVGITVGTFIDGHAFTSNRILFNNEYKTSGTGLDNCMTCHKKRSYKKNLYGSDYREAGYAFKAIEQQDSDGDGFSNIAEIAAGTFPGDPKSKPTNTTNRAGAPKQAANPRH